MAILKDNGVTLLERDGANPDTTPQVYATIRQSDTAGFLRVYVGDQDLDQAAVALLVEQIQARAAAVFG